MKKNNSKSNAPLVFWVLMMLGIFIGPLVIINLLNQVAEDMSLCGDTLSCANDAVSASNFILFFGGGLDVVLVVMSIVGLIGSNRKNRNKAAIEQNEVSRMAPLNSQAQTSTAAPQPASPSNLENELQKASALLKSGLIDEEEYKALKKKIIDNVH